MHTTRKLHFSVGQKPSLKGQKMTLKGVSVGIGADTSKLKANRSIEPTLTLVSTERNAKEMLIHKS